MQEPRNLLLTRPQAQAQAFADVLEQHLPGRFTPVIAPLMRIVPGAEAPDLRGAGALAFTSANGVAQFAARSFERGLPAYCVGDMTAAAARQAGLTARSAGGDVAALAALVARTHPPTAGAVVHVRGRHAAGDLVARLERAGLPARAAELYDQVPCPPPEAAVALLAKGGIAVLAVFSPRSAALFAEAARRAGWPLGATTVLALSPAADAALGALPFGRRRIAEAPTRAAMLDALAAV